MNKLQELISNLKTAVEGDKFWLQEIEKSVNSPHNIHLAIFIEPFLQWIIEGKKIIESRFSVNKCAPYLKITKGDLIVMKKSGGPIVAIAKAGESWFYQLESNSLKELRDNFSIDLCAQDPKFWESREKAAYATLIKIDKVRIIPNFTFPKRDRRGWIVLKKADEIVFE